MNNTFMIQSIVELTLVIFFIWGIFNEPKLAKLEKKLFSKISNKKKVIEHDFKNAA